MLSGGSLVSRSASSTAFMRTSPWNWGGNTLMPMRPGDSPIARPGGGFLAGGQNDPPTDVQRDGVGRKRLNERARHQHAAFRMQPAQQRFGADNDAVNQPDFRLEINLELSFRISSGQFEV